MDARTIILNSLEESQEYLERVLDDLVPDEMNWVPAGGCNSIIFTLWHLARVEDTWVNAVIRRQPDVYETEGWREKLGTPARENGYDYTSEQLRAWPVPPLELLRAYASSVREKTLTLLQAITPEEFSDVALTKHYHRYQTKGAILAHLITEIALHVGQIDYLHGLYCRKEAPVD